MHEQEGKFSHRHMGNVKDVQFWEGKKKSPFVFRNSFSCIFFTKQQQQQQKAACMHYARYQYYSHVYCVYVEHATVQLVHILQQHGDEQLQRGCLARSLPHTARSSAALTAKK